ncbi:MAG: glycosyltransferase family 2 protein [Bdellovibrionales bacterium]
MQNMKVSAIIPTYNRPETTIRAVKSILAQTHPCDEIIIIDDCSTDDSLKAIKTFIKENKLTHVETFKLPKNLGVSGARNEGVRQASNPWLAFLDSDDEWHPLKLEKQLQSLKESDCLISHTHENWVRNGNPVNQKGKHKKYGGFVYDKCIDMCFIGPSTSIIHKDIFNNVGLFDESFTVCEDYDLWLRITPEYEVNYIDEALLIKHGGHDDQLSTAFKGMDYWRALALKKQLNNPLLNPTSLILTKEKLEEKVRILIQGCLKHNNTPLLEKIQKNL